VTGLSSGSTGEDGLGLGGEGLNATAAAADEEPEEAAAGEEGDELPV
jgi:hypothetical protein